MGDAVLSVAGVFVGVGVDMGGGVAVDGARVADSTDGICVASAGASVLTDVGCAATSEVGLPQATRASPTVNAVTVKVAAGIFRLARLSNNLSPIGNRITRGISHPFI